MDKDKLNNVLSVILQKNMTKKKKIGLNFMKQTIN